MCVVAIHLHWCFLWSPYLHPYRACLYLFCCLNACGLRVCFYEHTRVWVFKHIFIWSVISASKVTPAGLKSGSVYVSCVLWSIGMCWCVWMVFSKLGSFQLLSNTLKHRRDFRGGGHTSYLPFMKVNKALCVRARACAYWNVGSWISLVYQREETKTVCIKVLSSLSFNNKRVAWVSEPRLAVQHESFSSFLCGWALCFLSSTFVPLLCALFVLSLLPSLHPSSLVSIFGGAQSSSCFATSRHTLSLMPGTH